MIASADIEQEKNGLYTAQRQEKLPADEVKAIIVGVGGTYYENLDL